MSFLRPEAVATLRRWRAVIIFGTLFSITFVWMFRSFSAGAVFWIVIAGAGSFFFGVNLFNAILKARIGSDGSAQGVVLIDEHRIGYFGPEGGGFVDMGDLSRLDVYNGKWLLHQHRGERLDIPLDAPNADDLLDMFSLLPGVTMLGLHDALRTRHGLLLTIWQRA